MVNFEGVTPFSLSHPDALVGGRFSLVALLKQGNGVCTYSGIDQLHGTDVIVKTVATEEVPIAVRMRLEHEAHVLEHLEIGGCCRVLDSGVDGPLTYLVQPRLSGVTLSERLISGKLSVDAALRVASEVLGALQISHEHGILHRDVKPANIIVQGSDPFDSVSLIDFGLARSTELDTSLRDEPVGTIRYVAPEAAGLIDVEVDQRADLYSLGIVLFECLVGRSPFDGRTIGELLRQHLNVEVPQIRSLGVVIPGALDGVVQRLVAKNPGSRYQSAASALVDVSEIIAGLAEGTSEPVVTLGLHDRRHVLTEPSFVGRSAEFGILNELLDHAAAGESGLVFVEAESGAGKTRLLDELAYQAGRSDFWVLRGLGVDQAAQRPFQVLDGVVAGIVAAEAEQPSPDGVISRMGNWAEAAVAALPALSGSGEPLDRSNLGPEAFGSTRSVEALTALIDALGQGERPVLVLLDDCQWADSMTTALLARWNAVTEHAPGNRVLLVAAFRSEEVLNRHPLRAIQPMATVSLLPFDADDVGDLCTSMAGVLPTDALETIVRLANGSPFMASAVLRGMVETGALRDTVSGWAVDPEPMQHVQTSRRAALLLARRFDLIVPPTMRLLTVGAILGKEFDLDLALSLTGQQTNEAAAALADAQQRRILWIDEATGRCSFAHDKLRESLLDRLDEADRTRLHGLAAEQIEAKDADRAFELAYHFDAANNAPRALFYALRAADLARNRHALDIAVAQYGIAERSMENMTEEVPVELRASIAQGFGEVLTLQGDYTEATRQLENALSLTSDSVSRAVIDGKLGDIAFKRGDQSLARSYVEGALRDLGRRVPRRQLARLVWVAGEAVVQTLHTLFPRLFVGRRSPEHAETELMAIRLYSRLAYIYWFSAGKIPCLWAHLRELNLAERYTATPELAQAYSTHAPVMTIIPWYARGVVYAKRSLSIRQELGDVWGQGQSLSFYGVVLYGASRFHECIDACREGIRLLERTGDRWEQNTATWHVAFSHYRLGELALAHEMLQELHASATAIGDTTAAGISLSGWARSTAGRVPQELIEVESARALGDAHTSSEVRLADAVRLLYAGDLQGAVNRLHEANGIVASAGMRQEYVAPLKPWLATALRMQVEATNSHQPKTRAVVLRQATRAARRADRLSRSFRNNRPHALRERGLIADLHGRRSKAQSYLRRSLIVAEKQEAAYEATMTRMAMAQLAVAGGIASAEDDLARAIVELHSVEPGQEETGRFTLSLAHRFEALLDVGRCMGTASSTESVYQEVHHAALQLLRGDRCHVVRLKDAEQDALITDSGEIAVGLSKKLFLQAVTGKLPVASGVSEEVDSTDSVVLADLQSVLCAPIICDGQVVACFYVTHHQLHGLFGDVELQLAQFIATLAGAALEHLAGSEAHFRSLAQNSSDVITIVDQTGVITFQSSAAEQVFGLRPEELVGQPLTSWVHPDDAKELLVFLDMSNRGTEATGLIQTRMRDSAGRWRVGESAVRNLFDDPGVEGLVLNTRDATERVALEVELRTRASIDPLTGLPNRALFVDRVGNALARRLRDNHAISIIFLDLDDFKIVNDTMGHAIGDVLLRDTGERLAKCVRPGDTVARFGGDEFALLLDNADGPAAEVVASRIIEELRRPYRIRNQEVFSRASVGVAVALGSETPDELLSGADTAMYVAKSRGKARYEVFVTEMREAAVDRSVLRNDLDRVLQRDELVIHYQPIYDLNGDHITGFEALSRWNHPSRGQLSPAMWIKLAEESGMIVEIGGWVLRSACQQLAQWQRADLQRYSMAVNVSARQLQDPELVDQIAFALEESGLSPGSLVLEITESATVEDSKSVLARLNSLKELGVGLSIDDFGTGYSSLSYLKQFPVDQLKVDATFVAGVVDSVEDRAIVASVISLGHSLGLSVVAEGVETNVQLEQVRQMGCDFAQGFLWSRPVSVLEMATLLAPV